MTGTTVIDVDLPPGIPAFTGDDEALLAYVRKMAKYLGESHAICQGALNLVARFQALRIDRDQWRRMCLDIDQRQDEPRVHHLPEQELDPRDGPAERSRKLATQRQSQKG